VLSRLYFDLNNLNKLLTSSTSSTPTISSKLLRVPFIYQSQNLNLLKASKFSITTFEIAFEQLCCLDRLGTIFTNKPTTPNLTPQSALESFDVNYSGKITSSSPSNHQSQLKPELLPPQPHLTSKCKKTTVYKVRNLRLQLFKFSISSFLHFHDFCMHRLQVFKASSTSSVTLFFLLL